MGIESDQLVYDYLSRVGDIAQQRALPSGQRMRLVNELRAGIDKVRAAEGAHSVAAVKQVLARFGSPGDIVEAAKRDPDSAVPEIAVQPGEPPAGGGGLGSRLPRPRVGGSEKWLGRLPRPRTGSGPGSGSGPGGWTKGGRAAGGGAAGRRGGAGPEYPVPQPAPGPDDFTPPAEPPPTAASPPHLAGEDEFDRTHADPDWWRVEPAPFGGPLPGAGGADQVPGFTGGIEVPELFESPEDQDDAEQRRPGTRKGGGAGAVGRAARAAKAANAARAARAAKAKQARREQLEAEAEAAAEAEEEYEDDEPAAPPSRRGAATRDLLRSAGLMEVLAMSALLGGAVLNQWMASLVGWALVYTSRRLSMPEKKWAALGVPGTVAAGGLVWLWGRNEGRWGEQLKEGTMGQAYEDMFLDLVRLAAVASTLFLLWRARRRLRS